MPRQNNRLSAISLENKPPGFHADGRGLYLSVSASGSRSWIFRYMLRGKSRDMGLGPFPGVKLSDARQLAEAARSLCRAGVDPIKQRDGVRRAQTIEEAKSISFEKCATEYFEANKAGWRNAKHAADWIGSLKLYAFPVFGSIVDVDVNLVLEVLSPIWVTKTPTAERLRGRIETVLGYARVKGYRAGDNPASWSHNLEHLLPRPVKVHTVKHHPALAYAELPSFLPELRRQSDPAAPALEFLILTATRSGEVRGAKLSEIDFENALWTIPAERMKAGRQHVVPLSPAALAIAQRARQEGSPDRELVFEGKHPGAPLITAAFFYLLREMKRADLTAHGFRSTFRDWAAAETLHENFVVEMAMAHTIGATEGAYRRSALIAKRRALMNDWAHYVTREPTIATVIPIRSVG
jgi:integrase